MADHLAVARREYEAVLTETRSPDQAEAAFIECMAKAAEAVRKDMDRVSAPTQFKSEYKGAGIAAIGMLPLLNWGLHEYLMGNVGLLGERLASAIFSTSSFRRQATELATIGRHFGTFIP